MKNIKNIFVDINVRTSRLEDKIFQIILEKIKKNIEKNEKEYTILTFKQEEFEVEEKEIEQGLKGLMNKGLKLSYLDGEKENVISFNYVAGYQKINETFTIFVVPSIINSFTKNSFEYGISLRTFFYLRKKIVIKFMNLLIKNIEQDREIEIELEELKDLLEIANDSYERFFDFEKNILKPLIKDLEIPYKIEYDKIKMGSNLNNKVIGIEFKFKEQDLQTDDDMRLKSILFMIKGDIDDISEVYKILKNGIKDHGYETTYRTCFKVKQRYKSINMSFDEVLKISFKKLDLKDIEPIVVVKKYFSSPKELRKTFMNELEKVKPGVILDTSFFCEKFLQDFILLKEDKILSFRNSEISLFINWKQSGESIIKIFLL